MGRQYLWIDDGAITWARDRVAGAKVMLFLGDRMAILRRDHTPGIPWPGYLDFPGGAREPHESPEACALRETQEELGLTIAPDALRLVHIRFSGMAPSWFYAAHLHVGRIADIRFGGEGEGWQMMAPDAFVEARDGIPHFRAILLEYLVRSGRVSKKRKAGIRPKNRT